MTAGNSKTVTKVCRSNLGHALCEEFFTQGMAAVTAMIVYKQ